MQKLCCIFLYSKEAENTRVIQVNDQISDLDKQPEWIELLFKKSKPPNHIDGLNGQLFSLYCIKILYF